MSLLATDPSHSVWVSASAGTGKTKLLVDRMLRILINHPFANILAITYTKAAASEMISRIKSELAKFALATEQDLRTMLHNLQGYEPTQTQLINAKKLFFLNLDSPDNLKIQTIHGFCNNILQKFPFEAGLQPGFKLMDNEKNLELRSEAIKICLTNVNEEHPFSDIASWMHENTLDKLFIEILTNKQKIITILQQNRGELKEKLLAKFGVDETISESDFLEEVDYQIIEELISALPAFLKTDIECSVRLTNFIKSRTFTNYKKVFFTLTDSPRKAVYTKEFAKKFEHLAEWLQSEHLRTVSFSDQINSLNVINSTIAFYKMAEDFLEIMNKLKKHENIVDYDDLIKATEELLLNPEINDWILYQLDGGIDHILLDEAQDTSLAQWKIINSLTSEFFAAGNNKTIFIVGDEKQSIYSFQGSDIYVFAYMREYFATKSAGAMQLINLELSYRSTAEVLKLVDNVYADPEVTEKITITESKIIHKAHRKETGEVRIIPIFLGDKLDQRSKWNINLTYNLTEDAGSKLAKMLAETIQSWFVNKRIIKAKNREIRPSDIMILVQKRGKFADSILSELKLAGLPVSGADRLYLHEHLIVKDLIAAAKFTLLPYDEYNLACLLKSPLIKVSEEELFDFCFERRHSLFEEVKIKAPAIYNFLEQLKEMRICSPFEFFYKLINNNDIENKYLNIFGNEASDVILEFLNIVLNYDNNHGRSLEMFVNWFSGNQDQLKRDLVDGNYIKLMTVHGSKGLESPIVILPDTVNIPVSREILKWDGEFIYYSPNVLNQYLEKLKAEKAEKDYGEYLRLLYVALTRAQDELFICGYSNRSILKKCWYELINNGEANGYNSIN